MMKFYSRDLVAALVILGLFALKLMGMNGLVDASLALVVGYYFSKRVSEHEEKKPKR